MSDANGRGWRQAPPWEDNTSTASGCVVAMRVVDRKVAMQPEIRLLNQPSKSSIAQNREPTGMAPAASSRAVAGSGLRRGPAALRGSGTPLSVALALAPMLGLAAPAHAAEVTRPILVPLETLAYPTDKPPTFYKYGIYVSLGGSATPQLFEFDTGGEGFRAAYSASVAWWGANVSDTGVDFDTTFDSGERYKGKVVKTGFSLFGLPSQGSPALFSTSGSDYKVGRTDLIKDNGTETWPNPGSPPPVQDYFYGDFGLALKKGADGIDNLFAQLTYGDKAEPGYIVSLGPYGSMSGSSLQLGLSHDDLHNAATRWFAMQGADPSKPFEHSGLPSFSAELLDSNLGLSGLSQTPLNLSSLGLNLDTGTPGVTLHYNRSQDGSALVPFSELDGKGDPISLLPGVNFNLTSVDTNTQTQTLLNLLTGDIYGLNKVFAFERSDHDPTYLNSGATLFQNSSVIFDLKGKRVGFAAYAAVPAPPPLLLSLGGWAWARRLRRRARSSG